ncbi:MAG: gamma-glutamyltransferase, partial [Gammaproteobacteria bacterium]|nr:gamma-glutamyltransferase [Gammaproteobacteria bacterium]
MKPILKFSFVFLFFFVNACSADPDSPASSSIDNDHSGATGTAAIAIPDPYAADVAERILRQGGNAVDAAIATGFALAVTYIDAGNIGGGGFMTVYHDGEPAFLDYRERAP